MEDGSEVDELRAALAARDADLAARDADLAAERAHRVALEERVAKLTELVRELRAELGQNSSNSNKPPSSDPPSAKKPKRKKRKGRRRGGQKGHRGSHRALLPAERVHAVVDLYPAECECGCELPRIADPFARRHQQTELCPLAARTTEWRRHAVVCPDCGYKTRAKYDREVIPAYAFGPRLMAVVAMLTGVYHLSRRQTVRLLRELLGVTMSLGTVSAIEKRVGVAVEPAVDEAWDKARAAAIKHPGGTTWLRAAALLPLWVVATTAVTVFKVLPNGQKKTLRDDLFGRVRGILVSDRATALTFWSMPRRQVCWSHLRRKFISFSERDGPAGKIGNELLEYTSLLFDYWARLRDGRLQRATFIARMAPVRLLLQDCLQRAVDANIRGVSGSCKDIVAHREALWTFVEREGVEPTNNHAERELRGIALWRRRLSGTQSARGDRLAARMMTIAHADHART